MNEIKNENEWEWKHIVARSMLKFSCIIFVPHWAYIRKAEVRVLLPIRVNFRWTSSQLFHKSQNRRERKHLEQTGIEPRSSCFTTLTTIGPTVMQLRESYLIIFIGKGSGVAILWSGDKVMAVRLCAIVRASWNILSLTSCKISLAPIIRTPLSRRHSAF